MNRAILPVDRVLRRTLPLTRAHRKLLKGRAWQAARFGELEIRLLRYLVDPQRTAIEGRRGRVRNLFATVGAALHESGVLVSLPLLQTSLCRIE
jgi:hypothetical protein